MELVRVAEEASSGPKFHLKCVRIDNETECHASRSRTPGRCGIRNRRPVSGRAADDGAQERAGRVRLMHYGLRPRSDCRLYNTADFHGVTAIEIEGFSDSLVRLQAGIRDEMGDLRVACGELPRRTETISVERRSHVALDERQIESRPLAGDDVALVPPIRIIAFGQSGRENADAAINALRAESAVGILFSSRPGMNATA